MIGRVEKGKIVRFVLLSTAVFLRELEEISKNMETRKPIYEARYGTKYQATNDKNTKIFNDNFVVSPFCSIFAPIYNRKE